MSVLGGNHQRRHAVQIRHIDVGARVNQGTDNVGIAAQRGTVHGRSALIIAFIDFRAVVNQISDKAGLSRRRGNHQRRISVNILFINIVTEHDHVGKGLCIFAVDNVINRVFRLRRLAETRRQKQYCGGCPEIFCR